MEENNPQSHETNINSIKDHVNDYLKNRFEYIKLIVIEGIAKTVPAMALVLIISLFFLLFWIFVNIAAILAFALWCDSMMISYLIVGCLNLILAIIFIIAYKPLIYKPLGNLMVKLLTKSIQNDEIK